jgi:hypothetical protein
MDLACGARGTDLIVTADPELMVRPSPPYSFAIDESANRALITHQLPWLLFQT